MIVSVAVPDVAQERAARLRRPDGVVVVGRVEPVGHRRGGGGPNQGRRRPRSAARGSRPASARRRPSSARVEADSTTSHRAGVGTVDADDEAGEAAAAGQASAADQHRYPDRLATIRRAARRDERAARPHRVRRDRPVDDDVQRGSERSRRRTGRHRRHLDRHLTLGRDVVRHGQRARRPRPGIQVDGHPTAPVIPPWWTSCGLRGSPVRRFNGGRS